MSDDPRAGAAAWPRGAHATTIAVARELPMLRGHFPDRSVVPGVAQLAMASALADRVYGGARPLGLRRVKFRAPVEPAAAGSPPTSVTCQLLPTGVAGEVEFVFSTGTETPAARAAEGLLALAPPRSEERQSEAARSEATHAEATLPRAPRPPAAPPPLQPAITAVLPHRAPALFVQRALHLGAGADDAAWFAGRVPADNFLVQDGRATVFAALEFAAQGAACLDVLRSYARDGARMLEGWLVGVKSAALHAPDFPAGAELVASLRTVARGGFVNVTTQIAAGGLLVADAELQIFVR